MATSKIGEWVAGKISECTPHGGRGWSGAGHLLDALAFFDRDAPVIFGMMVKASAIPEASALRSACVAAIQQSSEDLSKSDPAMQVALYEEVTRRKLGAGLAEPAIITKKRGLLTEQIEALGKLGRPSDALDAWPRLQQSLRDLRTLDSVPLEKVQEYLTLPPELSISDFEWLEDTWLDVGSRRLTPEFLPLADGGDGNYGCGSNPDQAARLT